MRGECPRLLEDVRFPPVLANDLLVEHYPQCSWPTLILGPQGTSSGLHRDTHDLPFYLVLLHGRKHWRVFTHDSPVNSVYFDEETNGFHFDAFSPDFASYPELGNMVVHDAILDRRFWLFTDNSWDDPIVARADEIVQRVQPRFRAPNFR